MVTNLLLKDLAMKWCAEVDWYKTVTKNGFFGYTIVIREVFLLEQELLPVEKRVHSSGDSSTTSLLATFLLSFRFGLEWVFINAVCRDSDEYSRFAASSVRTSGVDLETLFEQNPLWVQAGNFVDVCEESLSVDRVLIGDIRYAELISKKGYHDLVQWLAGDVNDER